MNITKKEQIMLDCLELITEENYLFIEQKEAKELLERYKNELDSRVKFKYFKGDYEDILIIEVYIDDCYIYTFECECDRDVSKEDTIESINIISLCKYA